MDREWHDIVRNMRKYHNMIRLSRVDVPLFLELSLFDYSVSFDTLSPHTRTAILWQWSKLAVGEKSHFSLQSKNFIPNTLGCEPSGYCGN